MNKRKIEVKEPKKNLYSDSYKARPFLKWAGGKTQILRELEKRIRLIDYRRYFEPFLGGGALFFFLQPSQSHLSDSNYELIDLYRSVRDDVEEIIHELKDYPNDENYFYKIRKINPNDLNSIQRAARFIYLNKTCFNGLFRVNRAGNFNVPFGYYKKPVICDSETLKEASLALQKSFLLEGDFEEILKDAGKGDLIYFDPPYEPLNKTSNFTSYTKKGFDLEEQKRLARTFEELDSRGCYLILSNSNTQNILDLYSRFKKYKREIYANRAINCKADGRGKITEVIITNFYEGE